uniref:ATP synthase F0 subunit 8 n=1 Tax=Gloeotilopsis planctonica TaxID=34157 RepID=A0A1B2RYW9_9CHLO|nr:ATP synthase F0 subunit 8 [Gloeotilopsis planctonica]
MPQLDTLSYFTQFIYLLLSFLLTYYFVVCFILPSTLTVNKLRAKFKSHLDKSKDSPSTLDGNISNSQTLVLDSLTFQAFKSLSQKSMASLAVDEFKKSHKSGQYNIQSALLLHSTNVITNKKRLIEEESLKV